MAQDCEGSWCKSQHESPLRTKLWFGPRLGRKRRSFGPLFPATRASAEAYDALLADLYSVPGALKLQKLTASPQGVIGAKEKRQETTFTPRLGRDLGNVYPIYDLARLLYEQVRELEDSEQEQQTPPPNFPPRLGRNLLLTESSTTGLAREQMLRYILQQLDL
ncbi:PBAN-type neuropeptides-like [Copidosoma floridanum]|uniref:PBAN-type neuropeptides-like n=1 Tax=Copidosoma floridanum TaxID=29053 RepID=UPI0006C95F15|nr:PBAN-type neuropeptides-like [Copidosoma floridanum]